MKDDMVLNCWQITLDASGVASSEMIEAPSVRVRTDRAIKIARSMTEMVVRDKRNAIQSLSRFDIHNPSSNHYVFDRQDMLTHSGSDLGETD
jgi:hypothetical protein